MGRKKNPENKDNIENLQEKLAAARQMRLAIAQNKPSKSEDKEDEEQNKQKFLAFWAKEKKLYGKEKDLEHVLWLHLKAIKHDKPSLFEEGIKHFGLKKIGE